MKLTTLQRMTLSAYLEYAQSRPTLTKLFRRGWKRYVILFGLGALGASMLLSIQAAPFAAGFLAFIAGAVLGDIGAFRRYLHVWPVLTQVLDHQRIRELLAEDRRSSNIVGSGRLGGHA